MSGWHKSEVEEQDITNSTTVFQGVIMRFCLNSDKSLLLIATLNGRHIGNCSLNPIGSYRRYAHRCEVAIALYQEFCGCGIGRTMLEHMLKVATKM